MRSKNGDKHLRPKKLKLRSRLSGSTIFDGRTAQENARSWPDLVANFAEEASRAEDSTRTVEQLAGKTEIRPRTADGRLEEGSGLTANHFGSEVKIDLSGPSCD